MFSKQCWMLQRLRTSPYVTRTSVCVPHLVLPSLSRSDSLSLAVPLTSETAHLALCDIHVSTTILSHTASLSVCLTLSVAHCLSDAAYDWTVFVLRAATTHYQPHPAIFHKIDALWRCSLCLRLRTSPYVTLTSVCLLFVSLTHSLTHSLSRCLLIRCLLCPHTDVTTHLPSLCCATTQLQVSASSSQHRWFKWIIWELMWLIAGPLLRRLSAIANSNGLWRTHCCGRLGGRGSSVW